VREGAPCTSESEAGPDCAPHCPEFIALTPPPAEGTEAALLLAMATNLAGRASLYARPGDAQWLTDLANELHAFAAQLGPDPLGVGEGEVRS
jgi:hypothetical protein